METAISKSELKSTAAGVFFMAFFGTLWSYLGVMGLQEWGSPWILLGSLVIGLVLLLGAFLLLIKTREFPNTTRQVTARPNKQIGKWFNLIFLAEAALIFLTIALCNRLGYTELIPIIIAIIVGIHFLPLAYLFQTNLYYLTGTLLTILPIMTWIFIPNHIIFSTFQMDAYMSVVGFGSALILWGSGLVIWMRARPHLSDSNK